MSTTQQVVSRTDYALNQVSGLFNRIWSSVMAYPSYWVIGALIVYIMFWCGCREKFYNVDWEQLGTANQSFGRTNVVAKLNDAVWSDCMPNGEFYVMRYALPKTQHCMYQTKKADPIRKGYFNSCGERVY